MDRDGTRAGYDLELLRALVAAVEIPVIASGGVGTLEHLRKGWRRVAPTPRWRLRSFTMVCFRWATPSATSRRTVSRFEELEA